VSWCGSCRDGCQEAQGWWHRGSAPGIDQSRAHGWHQIKTCYLNVYGEKLVRNKP
jgi:hypothetical protein